MWRRFKRSVGKIKRLRLIVDRGRLRIAGGSVLVAQQKDRFRRWGAAWGFMSGDEFEVNFLSPDESALRSTEGKTTRYHRVRPYAPAAGEVKRFAGRHESAGIGTVFQIEPKGDGLLVRLEQSPPRGKELKPVGRDTFQMVRMRFRFLRDKAGKVVAFDYGNPVIRSMKFTRLNDR